MYHFVTAVTTILTLSARPLEAQAVLATDCCYRFDSSIGSNPPSHPCSVVSSTSVRPSKSFTKTVTDERRIISPVALQAILASTMEYATLPNRLVLQTWEADVCLLSDLLMLPRFALTRTDYKGGCTDPTWSSPACAPQCSDLNVPDVVYNGTTKTWH